MYQFNQLILVLISSQNLNMMLEPRFSYGCDIYSSTSQFKTQPYRQISQMDLIYKHQHPYLNSALSADFSNGFDIYSSISLFKTQPYRLSVLYFTTVFPKWKKRTILE